MEDALRETFVKQELLIRHHARLELTILILVKKSALVVLKVNIVQRNACPHQRVFVKRLTSVRRNQLTLKPKTAIPILTALKVQ